MSPDEVWEAQKDDVFDVVADIDPPSARIQYAFLAGYRAASTTRQPEFCRCGRPAFYSFRAPDPRCPGCEYTAAATCDCVPVVNRITVPA